MMETTQLSFGGVLLPQQQITVHGACEELVQSQELSHAGYWMQVLHHAILRESRFDISYTPSEVFLCLQETALRFHALYKKRDEEKSATISTENHIDEIMIWVVWEEAMWAASALARVCVGPAWRQQLRQRRAWLDGHQVEFQQQQNSLQGDDASSTRDDRRTPPYVVATQHGTPSPRSYSPMTASTFGNNPTDIWFPPIPEVLPAAMLRFAASAIEYVTILPNKQNPTDVSTLEHNLHKDNVSPLDQNKHIAEAQRELVLALCCTTSEEDHNVLFGAKRGDWSILGAHEPVACILSFWLKIATNGWSPQRRSSSDEASLANSTATGATRGSKVTRTQSDEVQKSSSKSQTTAPEEGTKQNQTGNEYSISDRQSEVESTIPSQPPRKSVDENLKESSEKSKGTDESVRSTMTLSNVGSEPGSGDIGSMNENDSETSVRQIDKDKSVRSTQSQSKVGPKGSISKSESSGNQSSLSIATVTGALDWWYTLQVTRAATDLVSSGWRPPPNSSVGADVVLCLLRIAEEGTLLRPADLNCEPSATDREAREERLAAASSAAEAVSALVTLGSAGFMPERTHAYTVAILCRIQVTATVSPVDTAEIYPLGDNPQPGEEEEWELEKETFATQRESCFADTIDLLRVMLTHPSSEITAVTTLLQMADIDLSESAAAMSRSDVSLTSSGSSFLRKSQMNKLDAAIAIRFLGTSLWGNRSDIAGLPSLRVFWLPVLDLLCRVGSGLHGEILNKSASATQPGNSHDDKETAEPNNELSSRPHPSSLRVGLEAVVVLGMLLHAELIHGDGLLTPSEWDAFILALDTCVVPWLLCSYSITNDELKAGAGMDDLEKSIYKKISSEVKDVLIQLAEFLERFPSLEKGPYDSCSRQLHLLLLRKSVPCMEEELATRVALAVIASWVAVGFSPWRGSEWCEVASDILANALSVYDDNMGYVHSPRVRLEALRLITQDEGEDILDFNEKEFNDFAARQGPNTLSLSPLTLSRNSADQHSELIAVSILPSILSILEMDKIEGEVTIECLSVVVIPVSGEAATKNCFAGPNGKVAAEEEKTESSSSAGVKTAEYELYIYAVQLLGKLFRSTASERRHRALVVQILASVAFKGCDGTNLSQHPTDESCQLDKLFHNSLEAIRQLELCLDAVFFILPHAHQNLPFIIDALCSIVRSYGESLSACRANERNRNDFSTGILVLAALLPLCRLSVSLDRRLCLLQSHVTAKHVKEVLLEVPRSGIDPRRDDFEQPEGINEAPVVAPFITVAVFGQPDQAEIRDDASASTRGQTTEKTTFSFDPFVAVIASFLKASSNLHDPDTVDTVVVGRVTLQEVTSRLRSVCFDALANILLSGVPTQLPGDITAAVASSFSTKQPFSQQERRSRARAIATVVEYVHSCCYNSVVEIPHKMSSFRSLDGALVETLCQLCLSDDEAETAAACRGLRAVISHVSSMEAVSSDDNRLVQEGCTVVVRRLHRFLFSSDLFASNADIATPVATLSVLHDIFSSSEQLATIPDSDQEGQTYILCVEICSSSHPRITRFSRLLALRCAAAIVSRMAKEDVAQAFSAAQSKYAKMNGSTGEDEATDGGSECLRSLAVVLDLLKRRYQHFVECDIVENKISRGSTHDCYSKETEDISRFVVETDTKLGGSPRMAWMCRDGILTCRLGDSTSRYRGWMELVVRSPCARKRRMVRLSGKVSMACPEQLPSLKHSEQAAAGSKSEHSTMRIKTMGDPDVVSSALTLIEKCDSFFANIGIDGDSVLDASRVDYSVNGRTNHQQSPACRGRKEANTPDVTSASEETRLRSSAVTSASVETDKNSVATSSSGILSADETTLLSDAVDDSVHQWLSALLRDSTNVREVTDQLRQLGFSNDVIQMTPQETVQKHAQFEIVDGYGRLWRLRNGPRLIRAISVLDRTTTLQTHKIAILFAGHASDDHFEFDNDSDPSYEDHLLRATHGSASFLEFTSAISNVVPTRHLNYFSGGLDTSNYSSDGKYAALWIDEEASSSGVSKTMVVFHLVTIMPGGVNNRKRHVGNDNVHIIYVDQGYPLQDDVDRWYQAEEQNELQSNIMSGEFGFVTIFVVVLTQLDLVRVSVRVRAGLPEDVQVALRSLIGTSLVSKRVAPSYVRSIAVMADIACRSTFEDRLGLASNWEERLMQIREMERFLDTPYDETFDRRQR